MTEPKKTDEKELENIRARLEKEIRLRRRIENELKNAKQSAEDTNQDKCNFLASMGHELRTPLNAILGFSQILVARETQKEKIQFLNSIHASGEVLLSLINDIQDLSKIEAGKLDLRFRALDLKSFMEEINLLFARKAADKGLDLALKLDPDLPASLILDETRLRQICINLMSNAVKFTDQGLLCLEIIGHSSNGDGGSRLDLEIRVTDTGHGIAKTDREKIFEPFHQLNTQKSKPDSGTGLGLSIIRRLVELLGGKIQVTGEKGQGSTFKVLLPSVEVAAASALEKSNQSLPILENIRFERACLLIADDIDVNREMLGIYLETYPFDRYYAKEGRQTLEMVKKHKPDLILLDMKMPVMDGYEVSAELKKDERFAHIPVIAITADDLKQDEEKISKYFDGFLRKPFSKSELIREITRFLSYHKIQNPKNEINSPSEQEFETQLRAMSSELKTQLIHEANTGHARGVTKALELLGEKDREVRQKIMQLVEEFDFEGILSLLELGKKV